MNPQSLRVLNACEADAADGLLAACCGACAWRRAMAAARPFADLGDFHRKAEGCFDSLVRDDWLEAFAHHPKIGDLQSMRMKYAGNSAWSRGEQAGVDAATDAVLLELSEANAAYERRFGHIFIVCASGKSAAEMLRLLRERIDNPPDVELAIAAGEQRKITHLRIDKLECGSP
ncbi:Uric acid degradation bifunctional protein PucL [Pirellulimonas nuda]|uniref:2-oxo-4-hydroxy-4-carboxy-5-ureidoimidazoline decarboxylase n=1 Tax=Pirellulimonas nuda TaxID=2528009 RepID=A0A518DGY7_9BACT|nr:2-oxo-4-hydroxy-4-carboxy-5-ureidoimidazoline decarboxylase [Pirellulimonas nuda]QDU90743.1 Uric acid degradation bifunctional protein PucL [Pirellulimonas nuda]